jgi:hypothetical protein
MNRKTIFDAVLAARPKKTFDPMEVAVLDDCLDRLKVPRDGAAPAQPVRRSLGDAPAFFAGVRRVTGALQPIQVDTINRLLAGAAHWSVSWLAYGFATAWHEARLKPIEEIGRGRGRRYGVANARMTPKASLPTYGSQIPYGRGLVQLTWVENYEWADRELGLKGALLKDFELALDPDIAARILVRGMETGAFTSKALRHYLPDRLGTMAQFTAARKIINGTDRDELIAGHALAFQDALLQGKWQ